MILTNSIFDSEITLDFIVSRLFYPLWTLTCLFLFIFHLDRRDKFMLRLSLSILLIYTCSFLVPVRVFIFPINAIAILLAMIFLVVYCFKTNWKTGLFYAINACLLQNMTWNGDAFIRALLIKEEATALQLSFPFLRWDIGLCFSFTIIVCYVLSYFFFVRPIRKQRDSEIKSYKLVILSLLSVCIVYIVSELINMSSINNEYATRGVLFICCFALLYSLFSTSMADKLTIEKGVMDSLLKQEERHYEELAMTIETMNKRAHDLKYQLKALELKKEEESFNQSINELKGAVNIYERSPRTLSIALDNTLSEKMLVCENKDIQLVYRVSGKELDFMSQSDIYVLFGNALENAIDCVSKYQDKKDRLISMNSYQSANLLKFHIENTCLEPVKFYSGVPKTSKRDTRFHGYGTKNMVEIAKKYDGNVTFSYQDNKFMVDILLPLKAK